jgi:Protein of unknown function (DUF2568)
MHAARLKITGACMPESANLAVKFLLERAASAALAYWGARTGHGAWAVVLAIAALPTVFHQWQE